MTYYKILESHTFPHRFLVRYACACAREVAHLSSDHRVMNCITTAEAWLEGKATQQDCRDAATAAWSFSYPARVTYLAAYNAARTAHSAVDSAYNSSYVAYNATHCKVKGKDEEYFTKLLLTMIQTHLSSFEREMMGL